MQRIEPFPGFQHHQRHKNVASMRGSIDISEKLKKTNLESCIMHPHVCLPLFSSTSPPTARRQTIRKPHGVSIASLAASEGCFLRALNTRRMILGCKSEEIRWKNLRVTEDEKLLLVTLSNNMCAASSKAALLSQNLPVHKGGCSAHTSFLCLFDIQRIHYNVKHK